VNKLKWQTIGAGTGKGGEHTYECQLHRTNRKTGGGNLQGGRKNDGEDPHLFVASGLRLTSPGSKRREKVGREECRQLEKK